MTHDKTTGLDPNVLGAESQSEALKALHYIARTIGWLEVVPPYGDAVDRTKEADKAISCIETVRAALSQSPQGDCARKVDAQTWQPIKTAPKDGTRVLLFMNCGKQCVARTEHHLFEGPKWVIYGEMGKPNCWCLAEEDNDTTPTHWMQLPPAPASDDGVK